MTCVMRHARLQQLQRFRRKMLFNSFLILWFSWRSNEYAKFKCAIDSLDNYFDCGKGLEAQLRSDNLRRNGEHVLYVKGIDDYGNVGETISTRWIVRT